MKNEKYSPQVQAAWVMMPDREQIVKAMIGLIGMGLIILLFVGLYWYFVDLFYVPKRSILKTDGISLLWARNLNFLDVYKSRVQFFTPDNKSIIVGFTRFGPITALDLETGEKLWEVEMPHDVMHLHNDRFYITSYTRPDTLERAPTGSDQTLPDCSFGGRASLMVYDPYTGRQLWGYTYYGVDSSEIFFENQNIYLTGSDDHGASRSIARIDANSGKLLHLECNKWPDEKEVLRPPSNVRFDPEPFPHKIVYDEGDLDRRNVFLFFAPEGSRLNILDGMTKNLIGYAEFGGIKLNPRYFDIIVHNDIAVIHLRDSHQLFGIDLPHMDELRRAYNVEENCDCN